MKFLRFLFEFWSLITFFKGDQSVRDGICDFSGQGRDEYGK